MRTLIVMCGAPGAGKSTFIEEKGLTPYVLSPDALRLLHQAPELKENTDLDISEHQDKNVWRLLLQLLERRMQNGDLTVIDATHSRSKDFTQYKALAKTYRYQVVCVDFRDVSLSTLHQQNNQRARYKVVPPTIVETFHGRMQSLTIPSWITVVTPDTFDDFFQKKPIDLSAYKKIHHIGDIHSCYAVLSSYLKEGLQEDECYIFVGDYIDRGIQHAEVLTLLFSLMNRKNVYFLEGNHEIHLWHWANGQPAKSKEFERFTKPALDEQKIDKKTTRAFYRHLRQCLHYTYHGKEVLVTHGGLPHIPLNIHTISTMQFIKGVGDYHTDIDQLFTDQSSPCQYQIHGHRNLLRLPIQASPRSFNLEGQVEKGGHLRIVTLSQEGFIPIEVQNEVVSERYQVQPQVGISFGNEAFVERLRQNRYVKEKPQEEPHISSFNFTRDAFQKGIWNKQTIRARGLFINTQSTEIVARSYEKFFNVNELPTTQLDALEKQFVFPVTAYVKDNGFLGITGYDTASDTLLIASKSTTSGPYKEYFEDILHETVGSNTLQRMKDYMKIHNVSFVFEVNDPVHDPHMIAYEQAHVVLLDVIYRTPDFKKYTYDALCHVAAEFGLTPKKQAQVFHDWESFNVWYQSVTQDSSLHLEGYVLEDREGFMTKIKLPYYSFWKWMRTVKDRVARGQALKEEVLAHPKAHAFVTWLYQQEDLDNIAQTDIITLRTQFEQATKH